MLPGRLLRFDEREGLVLPCWLTGADHPWLRALVDEHERCVGRPRRELEARLKEPLPRAAPPGKLRIACHALAGLYRTERASPLPPPQARAALFGAAAGLSLERQAIVARAAAGLGVEPRALEASLFADLPGERCLIPPGAPVDPAELALRANLALAQGLLYRAASVRLELEGGARAVVRHARLRGLIGTVLPRGRAQDARLELSGPFALFRRTLLYGRALAELLPRLAWCDRYRLEAELTLAGRPLRLALASGDPILPAGEPRRFDSKLEERFAREFARAAPDWDLVREPEPVPAEGTLVFPDFALVHRHEPARRFLLEVVGFWTRDYLEEKLRRLRAAALSNLILCIDEERNAGADDLPRGARVLRFRRRIDPLAVLRLLSP